MKLVSPSGKYRRRAGFTLLELIGVLAIISILAATVAPTALRTIEAAAIKAEKRTLSAFSASIDEFAKANLRRPTMIKEMSPSTPDPWHVEISFQSETPSTNILKNQRNLDRLYIAHPTPAENRAMIISRMRPDAGLPLDINITTPAQFDQIWDTPEGNVPPLSSWGGWAAWNTPSSGGGNYILIERINLKPILDGHTFTFTFRDGPGAASYKLTFPNGTASGVIPVTGTDTQKVKPGMLIELLRDGIPSMKYKVTDRDQNFVFDGNWKSY